MNKTPLIKQISSPNSPFSALPASAMAPPTSNLQLIAVYFVLLLLPVATSVSFNFSSFSSNEENITFQGNASANNGVLQLTKNVLHENLTNSVGRATFKEPVRLWDNDTGDLTDFLTHFTFKITAGSPSTYGDGMAFFIAPFGSPIPYSSYGGHLGLFADLRNDTTRTPSKTPSKESQTVAVEFDTYKNNWDPSADHVGIDVNSIISVTNVSWNSSIKNGSIANAWVSYNSSTKNLSVFLTYTKNPVFCGNSTLSYILDLRELLPQWVAVGFSASTGAAFETHEVISWDFASTLEVNGQIKKGKKAGLIIGLAVGLGLLACGIAISWSICKRKKAGQEEAEDIDISMDNEFKKGTGPKRFTHRELSHATNNFAEGGKLGEGGFGGVYKGLLSDSNAEVAVKRVSRGSKQGKKEYVSEVKIISCLRHRNLVKLIGWCHEKGELLLVYEFMPNGSLDAHLFGGKSLLTWTVRYNIALGLASALLYLHEEWEQCVVHRDIKSSNVMLDSNFNAKLGDFGLARLVDHDLGSQTTVLAGTMGYMAPECFTTGKASKESDVYSFGAVALEIACGRRPVDAKQEPSKVRLVEWVWDLYGKGQLLEATDKRVGVEFDEMQMDCLMTVGLWCCHPDHTLRPSIRQVINVLNFEAPLPTLPAKLPVPLYYAPPLTACKLSYTSSGLTDTGNLGTQCSSSQCTTTSSKSDGSTTVLLSSVQ